MWNILKLAKNEVGQTGAERSGGWGWATPATPSRLHHSGRPRLPNVIHTTHGPLLTLLRSGRTIVNLHVTQVVLVHHTVGQSHSILYERCIFLYLQTQTYQYLSNDICGFIITSHALYLTKCLKLLTTTIYTTFNGRTFVRERNSLKCSNSPIFKMWHVWSEDLDLVIYFILLIRIYYARTHIFFQEDVLSSASTICENSLLLNRFYCMNMLQNNTQYTNHKCFITFNTLCKHNFFTHVFWKKKNKSLSLFKNYTRFYCISGELLNDCWRLKESKHVTFSSHESSAVRCVIYNT